MSTDKWKNKTWFNVVTPPYFGKVEVATIPTSADVIGRTVETTLYDITNDYSQTHIKILFKINEIEGNTAYTKFWGHDFTRDYLRSLVRRTTSQIKGIFNVNVNSGQENAKPYKVRVTGVVFTQKRAKTSQQKIIRTIMKEVIEKKAAELNIHEFIQECVLGKLGSEVYNAVKVIIPIRKSEIMKTKIVSEPEIAPAAS
ncbi:MAG: 30S ribosomal protein S3ae [Promethearchaeota archaeon]|nr:MAG: 30S ribosomal protein S3ae [Candidatus Lokiarchaeota archaeon]